VNFPFICSNNRAVSVFFIVDLRFLITPLVYSIFSVTWEESIFALIGEYIYILTITTLWDVFLTIMGRSGRDSMVVGYTTTCAISAYRHWRCEFKSSSWRGVLYLTLCDKVYQCLATVHCFYIQYNDQGKNDPKTNGGHKHYTVIYKFSNANPIKTVSYMRCSGRVVTSC
jgi:hypothetical protein